MARKVVDPTKLVGLVNLASNQEIVKGVPLSSDPKNFPVFRTPVNDSILVYIPRTNVIQAEQGEVLQVLHSHLHSVKIGNRFSSYRCISGLTGNELFDELEYDGTCPACEATAEAWELYNFKMSTEAAKMGIDPQNDPADALKPTRERILGEMDIRGSEPHVTFPIIIIPTKGRFQPSDDAHEKLEGVFVQWREQRYNDSIIKALNSMMNNPGHPGGQFMLWDFTYDTKGKPATPRDSAKNANYSVITDGQALQMLEPYRQLAEQKASEFTLVKATEVVIANNFLFKSDYSEEIDKAMRHTRQMLSLSKTGGGQPAIGGGQPAIGGGNPLAGFGQTNAQPQNQQQAPMQQAPMQQAPMQPFGQQTSGNLGEAPQGQQQQFQQQAPQQQQFQQGQPDAQQQAQQQAQPQGQPITQGAGQQANPFGQGQQQGTQPQANPLNFN